MHSRGMAGRLGKSRRIRLDDLARHGLLNDVARADFFDFGDDGAVILLYTPFFDDQDRATIDGTSGDGVTYACCDMRWPDDVAFALYLRDELDCTRGIAPLTISGQECALAGLNITWGD